MRLSLAHTFAGPALLFALLIAGCADSRGGSISYSVALAPPDPEHFQVLPQGYKIAPMDTLTIKVFKAADLSGDYSVDLAGHLSLPLIGQIEAADLTTEQLSRKLSFVLAQKYFEHPDVSVAIKSSTSNVITVDGSVSQSGRFPVGASITLIQAVALAHGTTDDANPRRIAVFRTIGGQREAAAFDLTAIRRGEARDPQLYPGDIVIVDGSKLKATEKQVLQGVQLFYDFRRVL